ncbi:helix-turn-helix domain-containing protein [Mariniphaga sediminis]|uniref:helix-turn-helix domain-containing protein n=1 Tax=Mariniphaga sediminis TaxID=1628158 RepID=UPI003565DE0D
MHIEEIGRTINFNLKNIAHLRFSDNSAYKNIISPFSRLYIITEGKGHFVFDGATTVLEPNYMYLIPSFTPCSYFFEKNLAHIYIHFSMEMPSGLNIYNLFNVLSKISATTLDQSLLQKCLNLNPGYELPHHDPKIYQSKPWINKEITYTSLSHYLETTAILKQLFSRFVQEELPIDINKIANNKFQNVLKFIQENIAQEISVSKLAELSFTSKDHFSRVFKSITGMPPSEFIIRKRLEKAKLLLLTTNDPLSDIISQTGFRTTAYFCRIFKKYTSLTPEQFRKNRG